jgi:nucleotide-binding universal stress UspA family protein
MKKFNDILCVVEADDSSIAAINKAVTLARNHQAKLTVVAVVEKPESLIHFVKSKKESERLFADYIEKKSAALDAFVKKHCKGVQVETNILAGIQFIEVIKDVLKNDRDLVVKCPNEEPWFKRLVGSNDMHLLRKCPCPVLLLKSEMTGACQKVLATIDVSDSPVEQEKKNRVQQQLNRQVLEFSSSFALADSAELHIGSVWDMYGEDFLRHGAFSQMTDESVDKYVEKARKEVINKVDACVREMSSYIGKEAINYIQPRVHLVKGLPAKEIPIMAEKYDIDLIVMGTIARTGIPGLIIGNTAEAILEQVNCSVLAIKPEGFKSPVSAR